MGSLQAPPTVVLLRLLLLGGGVRAQELGERPVPGQQLLVGAHLRDLAATHDDDDIHLRQVADAVGDQEPCLRAKQRLASQCPRVRGGITRHLGGGAPVGREKQGRNASSCGCFRSSPRGQQLWGGWGIREGPKDPCSRFPGPAAGTLRVGVGSFNKGDGRKATFEQRSEGGEGEREGTRHVWINKRMTVKQNNLHEMV